MRLFLLFVVLNIAAVFLAKWTGNLIEDRFFYSTAKSVKYARLREIAATKIRPRGADDLLVFGDSLTQFLFDPRDYDQRHRDSRDRSLSWNLSVQLITPVELRNMIGALAEDARPGGRFSRCLIQIPALLVARGYSNPFSSNAWLGSGLSAFLDAWDSDATQSVHYKARTFWAGQVVRDLGRVFDPEARGFMDVRKSPWFADARKYYNDPDNLAASVAFMIHGLGLTNLVVDPMAVPLLTEAIDTASRRLCGHVKLVWPVWHPQVDRRLGAQGVAALREFRQELEKSTRQEIGDLDGALHNVRIMDASHVDPDWAPVFSDWLHEKLPARP